MKNLCIKADGSSYFLYYFTQSGNDNGGSNSTSEVHIEKSKVMVSQKMDLENLDLKIDNLFEIKFSQNSKGELRKITGV